MLTPEFFESASDNLDKLLYGLENVTLQDIARRIMRALKIEGEARLTATAQYQMVRLTEIQEFSAFYVPELARITGLGLVEIDRLIEAAAQEAYAWDTKLWDERGRVAPPLYENATLRQIKISIKEQTRGRFKNLTQSLGFEGQEVRSYFVNKLDNTAMQVSSGLFDYNTAIKRTISDMVSSGLMTLRDASGRLVVQYGKRRLNAVTTVRNAVLTGVRQMADQVALSNMEALGVNLIETSAHVGARNLGEGFINHSDWQGKRFKVSNVAELRAAMQY
jgi:hypothetical protein